MITLTPYHKDVLSAKICPECKSGTRVTTETEIYGKVYKGRAMICCNNFPKCDSYVGTHDDGTTLGRLANKELRTWKKRAHDEFDKLWQSGDYDRDEAYENLSDELGIDLEYTHIGFFNIETCKKVIQWAKSI